MSTARAAGFVVPAHLEGLDRFEAGKPIAEVQRELGLRDVVKLASNENPLGPSPRAVEAAHAALAEVHRYPDPQATELRRALAAHLQVPVEQILAGNGSVEIIDLVARALLGPGDNAVISEHAFVRFRQIVAAHNHGARLVPMRDWTHDLAALPARCLLVLDEAYFEYAEDPDYPDGIELVRRGAPLVVTRTFSKVYGLGGLRAGYAVAAPEVWGAVAVIREAFGTNSVAQAAATAAVGDVEHVRRSLELNREQKPRLAEALRTRGFTVLPSLTNFVTFDSGRPGREVFQQLLAHGVIVRPLDPYRMPSFLRVSVGTAAENDTFLAALDAAFTRSGT